MTFLNRLLSLLLAALGAGLFWLGGQLLLAGGTPYYLVAAALLAGTAWFLWKLSGKALGLFGLLWVGTVAWALWESGLDRKSVV